MLKVDIGPSSCYRVTMSKYMKKPVVIEAVQFLGDNFGEIMSWMDSVHLFRATDPESHLDSPEIVAEVWDKIHATWVGVRSGDFIIQGLEGEYYPCDPDVFSRSYEIVTHS
jgi:hypothetical protein